MSKVEIVISGQDRSDSAFARAVANEKRLGDEAIVASGKLGKVSTAISQAGGDVDEAMHRAHTGIEHLNDGIDKVDGEVGKLREEFVKTGDVDFLKSAKKLDVERDRLVSYRNELGKLHGELDKLAHGSGGGHVGDELAGGLLHSVGRAVKQLPGMLVDGTESAVQSAGKWASENPMIAGGIAAGITLGAPAIGGALTAAVGAGGIAAGILLAAKDPKVSQAWNMIGHSALDSLHGAADVFVDPLVHGAEYFGNTVDRIMPSIRKDFDVLAPVADRLFAGAAASIERLMPGIDSLVEQSGPALDMLAKELPDVTGALSDMFTEVSAGSAGGTQALHDLLAMVEITARGTGALILATEKWYESERSLVDFFAGDWHGAVTEMSLLLNNNAQASHRVGDAVGEASSAVTAALTPMGELVGQSADDWDHLISAIDQTVQASDRAAEAWTDRVLNSIMGMDQATLGFAESQNKLQDTLGKTGIDMDIAHDKGQQMREGILAVVQANMRQYDAMMQAGAGATVAAAQYDENTQSLEEQMHQAHFTQGEIDELIGKYRAVPDKVNTNIATKGLADAIDSLTNLIRQVNNIDGRTVDIYFQQHGSISAATGAAVDLPHRYAIGGHAAGGIVGAASGGIRNGLTMVGERGWELLDLPAGTAVHSHEDSARMLAGRAGGGGVAQVEVSAAPGAEQAFVRQMLEWLKFAVRTDPAFAGALAAAGT